MLQNYLKIAWRNVSKDRQFTLLNILGLSTGLACTLLIYLWVSDERQMDKFFDQDSQLYQVMKNSGEDGRIETYEWTPGPLAKALADEMPEVRYAVTVASEEGAGNGVISAGGKYIRASEQYAGKDYFNVFSYPLLQGAKDQVLSDPYNVVISDQLAGKLFNTTENLVGKRLGWTKKSIFGPTIRKTYTISGIFKQPLYHASSRVDVVFALDSYRDIATQLDDWRNGFPSTYILFKENANLDPFKKRLAGFLQRKTKDSTQSLFMRRYSDKYLYAKYENGVQAGGRIGYVRLFSLIAFFLLVIACVNFMNLSTAKASTRMKEIGVKKVVGARRISLALQFMGESLLMAFLALAVATLLVWLVFPAFQAITGKHLLVRMNASFVFSVLGIAAATGLLAGSYPALYLSGFNSLTALKGKLASSVSELWVRKGLMIFQFTISAILIVSVLVVYKQMKFVQSANLGFDKDHVIVFKREGTLNGRLAPLLQDIKAIPGVVNAANAGSDLIVNYSGTDISWPGKTAENKTSFKYLFTGYNFIETLGIRLKEGRPFSDRPGSDTSEIILNEAAIDAMGLKDPIGRVIEQWGQKKEIVGVVKNFHFESLYERVKPCFLILSPDADDMMVRIKAGKEKETIERLQQFYQQYNPGFPFEFRFLDAEYQTLYESENRVATLSWWFAGMAVLISCLGLFGLAAFTAEKRRKEIGIRKVVGATIRHIAVMLTKDFLKLVLIAICVALPLAWWATHQWLVGFAYRVHIGVDVYLESAAMMLLITLCTVSYQAIRSAMANPVQGLRSE
jgi:putative ABC transport system permease protein